MKYAILADIHSNLEALLSVEKALEKERVDKCLCLGDIVGYGADPVACLEKTKALSSVIIAGNHDWAAAGKFDTSYFNPYAKEAIEWTSQNLTKEEKEFLANLPLTYQESIFFLVHGSLIRPEGFGYVLDEAEAEANMKIQKTQLCFIGHSHIPEIYVARSGSVSRLDQLQIEAEKGDKYLVNVGSIGQPRDGDPRASYCIFDVDKNTVSINRVEYDIKKAHDKILAEGLPTILAYRLLEGR